ncbi:MAG: tetratricopeptide repeat protein [Chloroflexi bacterium]|nr:MAG: tetratricopeptide repeat protein [Chloroflexota bacterium]
MLSLAQLTQHQGDRQQALQWVDESIALYRQLGDRWGTAEALRESGWVMYGLHQKQPTLARFEESLQLFRQTGDQAKIASLLTTLVHLQAGKEFDYTQSITYLRESILLLRTTDDTNALFFALTSQADFELQYGNYNAAEVVLNESLNIAQALGMQRDRAIALSQMGNVKLCQGDAPSALGYVQAALEIAQTIGDRDHCMHDWLLLGKVQKALDNLPAAQAAFAETLALCLSLENRHVASECLLHCGEIALNQKNDRWAVQLFAATQKMFDTLTPYLKPIDNTGLIEQIDQARTRLSEADFATAWAVGQGWSFEQAVSTARQWIVAL